MMPDAVDDRRTDGQALRAPVDVVIVTYRSEKYITACLESVHRALEEIPDARILVVDNASGDNLDRVVDGVSERVTLIMRDVNDGFAAGCHVGAERSTARRLLFLNPDAAVKTDSIQALLDTADQHPEAGIVGGRSVLQDGTTDHQSWMGKPSLWSALCFATLASSLFPGSRFFDPESGEGWDGESRVVPVVSGGMMLVERAVWDELGGFDRTYFLYGEDVDLCMRAASAGWSPRVTRDAVYSHEVGASSVGSNRLTSVLRGKATIYRRHLPHPWGLLAIRLLVAGTGVRAVTANLRPPGGRRAHPARNWRDSWHARDQWRNGW